MPYNNPGAAFSESINEFLMQNEAMKHQKLMDSLSLRREAAQEKREGRLEQQDAVELQMRQDELQQKRADAVLRASEHSQSIKKARTEAAIESLHEMAPGDIIPPPLKKELDDLGVPYQEKSTPPARIDALGMGAPLGFASERDVERPPQTFAGSREQRNRGELADLVAGGADRQGVTAAAIRFGMDPSKIVGPEFGAMKVGTPPVHYADKENLRIKGSGKIPLFDPAQGYVDPDTKQPVPSSSIERVPPPRDAVVDALARATLRDKNQATAQASAPIAEGTPAFKLAQDLAGGKITLDQLTKLYSFQRGGRDELRKIYTLARETNPSLSPLTLGVEVHSLQKELTDLRGMQGKIESFSKTADENTKLLDKVLDKIPETGISGPVNNWARTAAKTIGDENVPAFNTLATSLQSEYARLLTTMQGTGVVSDNARKELKDLLDKGGTRGQIRRVLQTLKDESSNRRKGLTDQIKEVESQLGNVATPEKMSGGDKKRSLDDLWKEAQGGG